MSRGPLLERMSHHPSVILLVVQLIGMLLYPIIESTPAGLLVFDAFGIVVLGFATRMVQRTAGLTALSAALALAFTRAPMRRRSTQPMRAAVPK